MNPNPSKSGLPHTKPTIHPLPPDTMGPIIPLVKNIEKEGVQIRYYFYIWYHLLYFSVTFCYGMLR